MLKKLDSAFGELKIKSKWSEIESYGITEMLYALWRDSSEYESLAHSVEIDNKRVCLNLYEGVSYEHDKQRYRLIKAYIDINDNILFLSISGEVFIYETTEIDGADLKHYAMGD